MLISHKKKFIFVHIYKTAGDSVRDVFLPYARLVDKIVYHYPLTKLITVKFIRAAGWEDDGYKQFVGFYKHSTASEIRDKLNKSIFENYYKFAFVRNPFDWLISLYFYIRQSKTHGYNKLIEDLDFKDFIKWYISENGLKQTDFLIDPGKGTLLVDYVGRFENLYHDVAYIVKTLSLPSSFNLPYNNPSFLRTYRNYKNYYDQSTISLVKDFFRKDFQLLGYNLEGFDETFHIISHWKHAEENQMAGYSGINVRSASGVFAKIERMGWTGIAFVNTTGTTVHVTLNAKDNDGSILTTTEITLEAYEKRMGYAETFFEEDIGFATFISYSATAPVVSFQLNGSSDQKMLDVLPGLGTSANTLYFLHVDSDGYRESEVCIVNTDPTKNMTGVLTAYSDTGEIVSILEQIVIGPQGRRQIIIGQEFSIPKDIGYLVFKASQNSAVGYTKFYVFGQYRVALPAVVRINTGDIFVPHIACNAKWWTEISLVNTSALKKKLTIEFNTGQSYTFHMRPSEQCSFTIREIFGGKPQPNIQSAVIRNGNGVVGLELFGSGNLISGILLKNETDFNLFYPHIPSDMTWWTGIVAYNPNDISSTVMVTAFGADGTLIDTQTVTIGSKEKYIGTASMLGLPINTSWLYVESNLPISGFELFISNKLNVL